MSIRPVRRSSGLQPEVDSVLLLRLVLVVGDGVGQTSHSLPCRERYRFSLEHELEIGVELGVMEDEGAVLGALGDHLELAVDILLGDSLGGGSGNACCGFTGSGGAGSPWARKAAALAFWMFSVGFLPRKVAFKASVEKQILVRAPSNRPSSPLTRPGPKPDSMQSNLTEFALGSRRWRGCHRWRG